MINPKNIPKRSGEMLNVSYDTSSPNEDIMKTVNDKLYGICKNNFVVPLDCCGLIAVA